MKSPRVLLVEDEEALRRLLRLVLERKGFEVLGEAEDGLSGVEAASRLSPDVVVMDLNMPNMDGIEATKAIKKANPSMPVLFYSAYADESLRAAAAEAGAAGWVVKGAPSQELLDGLNRVVEQSRSAGAG